MLYYRDTFYDMQNIISFIIQFLTDRKKAAQLFNCWSSLGCYNVIIGHISYILRKRSTDNDTRFERKLRV